MSESVNTAEDWLKQWDAGETVWSITMGGLSPGYEQAIQITASEVLRDLLARKPDPARWEKDPIIWKSELEILDDNVMPKLDEAGLHGNYGLSGAQWSAAINLAMCLYRRGTASLDDEEVKDRRIRVSKQLNFASSAPA